MWKELRPSYEESACEICARTILKGEPVVAYLAPEGRRMSVCELCVGRAEHEGWIRESAHADLPATRTRIEPKRSMLARLRRRRHAGGAEAESNGWGGAPGRGQQEPPESEAQADELEPDGPESDAHAAGSHASAELDEAPDAGAGAPEPRRRSLSRLKEPFRPVRTDTRHVRAVPTNAQLKVERALEVFNGSEHHRTIAGLVRTLGEPWVSAHPDPEAPSEVVLVVAWELSWYRYRIDLGDAHNPVSLYEKGLELSELGTAVQDWNGSAGADGRLVAEVAPQS